MRVYIDNCCLNRPYDDQTQMRIHLETEAKLYIQELVKNGSLSLVTSYLLEYENGKNPYYNKRDAISSFMDENESYYVSIDNHEVIEKIAKDIMKSGIRSMDALHIGCAMVAECDFFITTDDKLLRYQSDRIHIVSPTEFVRELEEQD